MSLRSLYRTLVVNYVELDNIILSSRDSEALVSALLLVTDSELLANVTEVESSRARNVPVVVIPPVLNSEVDSTYSRSVCNLHVLYVDSSELVSKAVDERELHLREEVAESEGYRRLRNSVLSVYRSSSIEEVLSALCSSVVESNSTKAEQVSTGGVNSSVGVVSERCEIVSVTSNPVLSVCVTPSVTTLSYELLNEYLTSSLVHETPNVESSEVSSLSARISSNIGTRSILDECVREVDLRILWEVHDLGSVTSYSSSYSENRNE